MKTMQELKLQHQRKMNSRISNCFVEIKPADLDALFQFKTRQTLYGDVLINHDGEFEAECTEEWNDSGFNILVNSEGTPNEFDKAEQIELKVETLMKIKELIMEDIIESPEIEDMVDQVERDYQDRDI